MSVEAPAPSLWRDRRFLRFWFGQTVSQFGDRVTELALPLIATTTMHASVSQVAWLTALIWTPNLVAIVLGAWVDQRVHKRRLMVVADLIRAFVLLSLPASYLAGTVTLGQLYVVALLTGTAASCSTPPTRPSSRTWCPARPTLTPTAS